MNTYTVYGSPITTESFWGFDHVTRTWIRENARPAIQAYEEDTHEYINVAPIEDTGKRIMTEEEFIEYLEDSDIFADFCDNSNMSFLSIQSILH